MTERAWSILREHFGARTGARLPDALLRWVKAQRSRMEGDRFVLGPLEPFVVERHDRRVIVSLVPGRDQSFLLLAEVRRAPGAASLESIGLTPREAQVLSWVTRGRTNADIARGLDIKHRTVDKHMEHILRKLGVETRTAAAVRGIEHLGIQS